MAVGSRSGGCGADRRSRWWVEQAQALGGGGGVGRGGLIRRAGPVGVDHGFGLLFQSQQEPLRHAEQDRGTQHSSRRGFEIGQGGLQSAQLEHPGGLEQGDQDQPGPCRERAQDRRAEQRCPRAAISDGDAGGEHQPLHAAHQPPDRPGDQQHAIAQASQDGQGEQGDQDDPSGPVVQARQLDGVTFGGFLDLPEVLIQIGPIGVVQLVGVGLLFGV